MDRTFHIDPDAGLVTIKLSGAFGMPELRILAEQISAHPAYHPSLPQLVDCRDMAPNREQFQPREFLGFALRFYRSRAHTSIALVVDPTMERGVMATIYRLACAMGTAELFDDYQLALKWLMRCEFAARGPALQHDPASPLTGAAKFHR